MSELQLDLHQESEEDSVGSMLLSLVATSASAAAIAVASASAAAIASSSYEHYGDGDGDGDEVDDHSLIRTALSASSSSPSSSSSLSSVDAATALSPSPPSSTSSSFSSSFSSLSSSSFSASSSSASSRPSSTTTTTTTTRHLSSSSSWFDVLTQSLSSALLFLLIFGMSATVEVSHLREQVHNKFAILAGVSTQFLVMPLLGFLSVRLLRRRLTEPMALSLLLVTASPGGSYSNWWCSMFNADLALSVAMTAISTLVSSVMLPANLLLYVNAAFGFGGSSSGDGILRHIDWGSLFVSLAIVVVAIGLGLCASFKVSSHRFNRLANRMGSLAGVLLVLLSAVLTSLSGDGDARLWAQSWSFYLGVSLPCLVGLVVATGLATLARLKKPEVVSVGVECCYQNVGICTSAVIAIFDDPADRGQALCVPLFYGLMEAAVLGLYCIAAWKVGWTKAPRDEGFWTMIVTAYEVSDDENDRDRDRDCDREDVEHGQVDDGEGGDEEAVAVAVTGAGAVVVRQVPPLSPTRSVGNATTSEETWKTNASNRSSNRSSASNSSSASASASASASFSNWHRWPWSLVSGFFRRHAHERSPSPSPSLQQPSEIDDLSPSKRIALGGGGGGDDDDHNIHHDHPFLRDNLESITEDGFGSPGSLVSFADDKISYSRCRLSSEDSATAITVAMSEDSPSHAASTATVDDERETADDADVPRRTSSSSLLKGNF